MTQAFNLSQLANNLNTAGQLDATDGLSGVVPLANLPTIPVSKGGTNLTATPSNGQIPIGNGSGYSLATLTAGTNISISNGAGSVTINATAGSPSTSQVLSATAGATAGAIGTYAFLRRDAGGTVGDNGTSGGPFNFTNIAGTTSGGSASGTWRCVGFSRSVDCGAQQNVTVWLRIS
jgi:hypothetical protein